MEKTTYRFIPIEKIKDKLISLNNYLTRNENGGENFQVWYPASGGFTWYDAVEVLLPVPSEEREQKPDGYIYEGKFVNKDYLAGRTFHDLNKPQPVYFAPKNYKLPKYY